MSEIYSIERRVNVENQIEELKKICMESNVDYERLNTMLEAEKIKKLYKRVNYINKVITEIIED
ncbi:hypothetical protein ACTXMK_11225 [Psychrobacter celer]|uniref:hypothetical protein n=1 Tax=Psychrobacter TaxID=497 RepID=UPI000C2AACF3|nr:hypothetical protein [Psychrobacter sp. L7]PJX21286.1 hypothetical protein CAP50_10370 [Psychrobacter sp. L7]